MRFRPCIDIHNGKVKQIVGSSLKDSDDSARENFASEKDAVYYAKLYESLGLSGGHIILLNPCSSPHYASTRSQAMKALKACPGRMQIGGGITPENASDFLDSGASHVIVTSYVFKDGLINYSNLDRLVHEVGKKKLVLDLSCKLAYDGNYYIVTDRWQKMTTVPLSIDTLDALSGYCDEFLIHAADVEGKQSGIEENVAGLLGSWAKKPITYAGGIRNVSDIELIRKSGNEKLDFTVGSALDIFGGNLSIDEIIRAASF